MHQWRDWDFDNFRFIIHELYLYAVACYLRHDRFEAVAYLLGTEYYVPGQSDYGKDEMVSFPVFRKAIKSLDARNQRLGLRKLSLHATLLKERCTGIPVPFHLLMEADFVLYLRSSLREGAYRWWWPVTLLYASTDHRSAPFEMFARSKSQAYFNRAKVAIDVASKDELEQLLKKFEQREIPVPQWEFSALYPRGLVGFNAIGTKA